METDQSVKLMVPLDVQVTIVGGLEDRLKVQFAHSKRYEKRGGDLPANSSVGGFFCFDYLGDDTLRADMLSPWPNHWPEKLSTKDILIDISRKGTPDQSFYPFNDPIRRGSSISPGVSGVLPIHNSSTTHEEMIIKDYKPSLSKHDNLSLEGQKNKQANLSYGPMKEVMSLTKVNRTTSQTTSAGEGIAETYPQQETYLNSYENNMIFTQNPKVQGEYQQIQQVNNPQINMPIGTPNQGTNELGQLYQTMQRRGMQLVDTEYSKLNGINSRPQNFSTFGVVRSATSDNRQTNSFNSNTHTRDQNTEYPSKGKTFGLADANYTLSTFQNGSSQNGKIEKGTSEIYQLAGNHSLSAYQLISPSNKLIQGDKHAKVPTKDLQRVDYERKPSSVNPPFSALGVDPQQLVRDNVLKHSDNTHKKYISETERKKTVGQGTGASRRSDSKGPKFYRESNERTIEDDSNPFKQSLQNTLTAFREQFKYPRTSSQSGSEDQDRKDMLIHNLKLLEKEIALIQNKVNIEREEENYLQEVYNRLSEVKNSLSLAEPSQERRTLPQSSIDVFQSKALGVAESYSPEHLDDPYTVRPRNLHKEQTRGITGPMQPGRIYEQLLFRKKKSTTKNTLSNIDEGKLKKGLDKKMASQKVDESTTTTRGVVKSAKNPTQPESVFYDKMMANKKLKDKRLEYSREKKKRDELKQCTFKPILISHSSHRIKVDGDFYERNMRWLAAKNLHCLEVKAKLEDEEIANCDFDFHPTPLPAMYGSDHRFGAYHTHCCLKEAHRCSVVLYYLVTPRARILTLCR